MSTTKIQRCLIAFIAVILAGISYAAAQTKPAFDLKGSIERGSQLYTLHCTTCHMETGEGLEGVFPPVAKSDYLMADKKRSIQQTLYGASGEIKVNGKTYNGEMPAFDLSDSEISDVLNYIRNSWGNKGEAIRPEEVRSARKN